MNDDHQISVNTIVLDEDLRDVFPDSESVNRALRDYRSLKVPTNRISDEEFVKRINEVYTDEMQEEARREARTFSLAAAQNLKAEEW